MTLIIIKQFLARLFGSRYTWYAIAAGAALYGAAHWHHARVDDAVARTTATLTAEFEAQKKQAIKDETERGLAIVAQTKEDYDAQINTLKNDAARMVDGHRSGSVRLSIPADCTSPIVSGNGSSTQPNTVSVATESRAELSDAAVEFFVGEAERADKQAIQLNALIDVVEHLRTGVR
ncbi:MAG: lysis protein [Burkholderiales bacterium]|nr:lysis protein [Burkholderiales bacterium]